MQGIRPATRGRFVFQPQSQQVRNVVDGKSKIISGFLKMAVRIKALEEPAEISCSRLPNKERAVQLALATPHVDMFEGYIGENVTY